MLQNVGVDTFCNFKIFFLFGSGDTNFFKGDMTQTTIKKSVNSPLGPSKIWQIFFVNCFLRSGLVQHFLRRMNFYYVFVSFSKHSWRYPLLFLDTPEFCFSLVRRQKWCRKYIVNTSKYAPWKNIACNALSASQVITKIVPTSQYMGFCGP